MTYPTDTDATRSFLSNEKTVCLPVCSPPTAQ